MERRLPEIIDLLVAHLSPASVTLRHDAEVRLQEELPLVVETVLGRVAAPGGNPGGSCKAVGGRQDWPENRLFLDSGKTAWPRRHSLGEKSWTPSLTRAPFAMHLAPGARRVTLVESSGAALAVAQENASLNGYETWTWSRQRLYLPEGGGGSRAAVRFYFPGPAGLCQKPPGP